MVPAFHERTWVPVFIQKLIFNEYQNKKKKTFMESCTRSNANGFKIIGGKKFLVIMI